jgi:hypothetical protein
MGEEEIIGPSTKSYIRGFKRTQTTSLPLKDNNDVTKLVLDSPSSSP